MIEFPLGEFAMKTGLELADMVVAAGAGFYEGSSLTLNNLNWVLQNGVLGLSSIEHSSHEANKITFQY